MEFYRKIIVIFLVFPSLSCACAGLKKSGEKISFYMLEYETPRKLNILEPFPLVIGIEHFNAASEYNTNLIVYRDRAFKRNTYTYHRWREKPEDMVTHFLYRDLKESGLFKTVCYSDNGTSSSHILGGSVDEFFQWDAEENLRAVLFISIDLMEKNRKDTDKKILFSGTYSTSKVCRERDPDAVAKAMSEAMKEVSGKIIEDLYHFLKDRY
ncbi:MAG: ABC-type transport auxiliary lipoprotein family protein [bacterium]